MKRSLFILCMLFSYSVFATGDDEGMWLPLLLKKYNYDHMKQMGLKLTAEQLYDVNNSSLKDAIVCLGGFCTGELVSSEGLMLTNHHCGYDAVATHSSVEHDYLTNGFWAMSRKEELQNPGLYADILVRMEDVTDRVSKVLNGLEGTERSKAFVAESKKIREEATKGTHYMADVKAMFRGNEFYLIVFERFNDVRLVGAPPSAIGKFGGDTDNWMWPRHTGDFSMFRVYAGKDNKPAQYSPDNVPYKPKHVIPVSMKGYKPNDFTMVYGYPGQTDRYLTSFGIKQSLEETNPALIATFGKRLEIMKKYMDADPKVRIAVASDYASLSNSWKYFLGQSEGLKKLDLVAYKQREEKRFTKWVKQQPSDVMAGEYASVLENIGRAYDKYKSTNSPSIYCGQLLFSTNGLGIASQFKSGGLVELLANKKPDKKAVDSLCAILREELKENFKNNYPAMEQEILAGMLKLYVRNVPVDKQLPSIAKMLVNYKAGTIDESIDKFAATAYKKSVLVSWDRLESFLKKPSYKVLRKDPLYSFYDNLNDEWMSYRPASQDYRTVLSRESRILIKGMRLMDTSRAYYPDANSSLRLTYGKVMKYQPKDAVEYDYFTTLAGVIEKEDPTNEEFIVPAKLKELYMKKDFGPYAWNGDVPVAFITDNDITGGNSGSPVFNDQGQLIGIAFDGNWEAMTGDLVYDGAMKRCINVDIRYVLFVIDKYAGAGHLVKEMQLAY